MRFAVWLLMSAAAVLFVLLAAVTPATGAEPGAAPIANSAIYFESGLGSPLGIFGVESVTRVAPRLEIAIGAGIGLAAAESGMQPSFGQVLQWSLMPRLLLGNSTGGLTIGVGASGGGYGDWGAKFLCWDDPCPSSYHVIYAVWANAEIGGEVWATSGLAVRFFAGWAHGWCANGTCGYADRDFPYLGGGLGYAF